VEITAATFLGSFPTRKKRWKKREQFCREFKINSLESGAPKQDLVMGQELEQAVLAPSSRWIVPPLAGAVSGVAVVLFGQPFDTIKVRMQVLNQRALPTFQQCLRLEGVTGLYKGTTPQLPGSAMQHSVRMGSYGVAKEALLQVLVLECTV